MNFGSESDVHFQRRCRGFFTLLLLIGSTVSEKMGLTDGRADGRMMDVRAITVALLCSSTKHSYLLNK